MKKIIFFTCLSSILLLMPYVFIGKFYGIVHFALLLPWSFIAEEYLGCSDKNWILIGFINIFQSFIIAEIIILFVKLKTMNDLE